MVVTARATVYAIHAAHRLQPVLHDTTLSFAAGNFDPFTLPAQTKAPDKNLLLPSSTERLSCTGRLISDRQLKNLSKDLEMRHPRCVGSVTKNFVCYTYSETQLYFTY